MRQWTESSLAQLMAFCLFGTKPLFESTWCWFIVLRKKLQRNLNHNSKIFFQENIFERVVCKMSVVLFRPEWPPCCKQHFHSYLPEWNFACILFNFAGDPIIQASIDSDNGVAPNKLCHYLNQETQIFDAIGRYYAIISWYTSLWYCTGFHNGCYFAPLLDGPSSLISRISGSGKYWHSWSLLRECVVTGYERGRGERRRHSWRHNAEQDVPNLPKRHSNIQSKVRLLHICERVSANKGPVISCKCGKRVNLMSGTINIFLKICRRFCFALFCDGYTFNYCVIDLCEWYTLILRVYAIGTGTVYSIRGKS